jgi:hypothetical protein
MKRKMKLFPRIAILLCLALVAFGVFVTFAAARPSIAAGDAAITYRKVFKGSTPESVELIIRETGKCTYDIRQLAEDPKAQEFEVGQPVREKIFSLAKDLNYFKNLDLDTHRKIANLGAKTFRYEKDRVANEVTYNYTVNTPASQLQQIFEGLSYQQDYMQTLARTLKYDRLGLYDVLGFLEADLENGVIPEPEHLLPVLEQISNDTHVIEIARSRSRAITTKIRNAK